MLTASSAPRRCRALSGGPAVVGHVRAGLFPRDMAVAPDGTLLVSNFSSGQLEAVALRS